MVARRSRTSGATSGKRWRILSVAKPCYPTKTPLTNQATSLVCNYTSPKCTARATTLVVIDLISQDYTLRPQDVRRLADRHFGVGCDQVLTVEAPHNPQVDFHYRIYNADGKEGAAVR